MAEVRILRAMILAVRNYGEADRIIEVLTPEEGRLGLFAAGARKSRRRFAGILEPFNTLGLHVIPKPGLWRLQAADPLVLRMGIRQSFEAWQRATALCESALLLSVAGSEATALCLALEESLDALERGHLQEAVAGYFRLFRASGIQPEQDQVQRSPDEIERRALYFLQEQVGMRVKSLAYME